MDTKLWYQLITSKETELSEAALNNKLPEGTYGVGTRQDPFTRQAKRVCTHVALMSLDNWDRNTTAGTVTFATPRIAAQRIVEAGHRLATSDEVVAEKLRQEAQKKEHDRVEALLNKRTQIAIKVPQD